MAYTDEELRSYAESNKIPANAVRIRTTSGGAVWVNPAATDTIRKYTSGQLTGGQEESASAPGTYFRVLPIVQRLSDGRVLRPITPGSITAGNLLRVVRRVSPTPTPIPSSPRTATVATTTVRAKFSTTVQTTIKVIISPAAAATQQFIRNDSIVITPSLIDVNLSEPLVESALQFLQTAINTYVDEERTLKTLLNYGEDRQ
jgi:hypothetical protein